VEGAETLSCQATAKKPEGFPPEMCANLMTNYKKRLTSVLANKGCFAWVSNTYFPY